MILWALRTGIAICICTDVVELEAREVLLFLLFLHGSIKWPTSFGMSTEPMEGPFMLCGPAIWMLLRRRSTAAACAANPKFYLEMRSRTILKYSFLLKRIHVGEDGNASTERPKLNVCVTARRSGRDDIAKGAYFDTEQLLKSLESMGDLFKKL